VAKATFPFTLTNRLEYYVKEKQLELLRKFNVNLTWKEIFDDCGDYCGVTGHTIRMIKSGSSNPSVFLAILIAKYFDTTVDDMFGIVPEEDGIMDRLNNWKPCGLE